MCVAQQRDNNQPLPDGTCTTTTRNVCEKTMWTCRMDMHSSCHEEDKASDGLEDFWGVGRLLANEQFLTRGGGGVCFRRVRL